MENAYIVSAVRTAVGKAIKGVLKNTLPTEMLSVSIKESMNRIKNFDPTCVNDVIIGCAMPEAEQGMNIARLSSVKAGIPYSSSAMTINRFCSSGLQAIALGAKDIMLGLADVVVAGGVESMSLIPMGGNKIVADPSIIDIYPEVYITMGLAAERQVEKFKISREEMDTYSLESHQKASKAISQGRFESEIVSVKISDIEIKNGKKCEKIIDFKEDEGPRKDTSLENLSKLKPAFKNNGVITAGNSSQMSDGASAVILMSEKKIRELNVAPIARFVSFATHGCEPDLMGTGPIYAIPKALKQASLKLNNIDLIELNEAFAVVNVLCIKELGLDNNIVNVNGGAIALGHPLGCTGSKLTTSLIYELKRRNKKYGIVSMCVGGGMGAAGIIENLQ
jgi:acetyl-CoA acyltransferase